MKNTLYSQKLPALICAGSFVVIIMLASVTNPSKQIASIIIFFIFLLVFLVSLSSWLSLRLQKPRAFRRKMMIGGIFITLALMFNSAGSLTLIDALILLLTMTGLGLYFDRRQA